MFHNQVSPRHLKAVQNRLRIKVNSVYLWDEINKKLSRILHEKGQTLGYFECIVTDSTEAYMFYKPTEEERDLSLTHLAWQVFEEIDEILELDDIQSRQLDNGSLVISGTYVNKYMRFELTISPNSLNTCKVIETEETQTVKVKKVVCND